MTTKLSKIMTSEYISCTGGLYKKDDPTLAPKNKLSEAKNVHINGEKLTCRPGKRKWSDQFSGVFRGCYEYIDNVGNSHILAVNGTTLYEVYGQTATARDTNLSGDDNVYFTALFGKCFYNSYNTQRKIDGIVSSDVGLDKPTNAPSAAITTAGGLTGSYAWVFTYVIEDGSGSRLYESNPSPVSSSLNLATQQAEITPGVSADTRVNARYIYRSYANGNKYYYEGKISNNTSGQIFTSGSVSDAVLGDEVEFNHAKPIKGLITEKCNNRLYWLVSGNMLYYSEIADTDAYAEYQRTRNLQGNLINVAFYRMPNNGRSIGLKSVYNKNTNQEDLYIFQERSILRLPAGDPTAKIYTLLGNVGCKCQDSIAEHNGRLIWLTNKNNIGMLSNDYYIDLTTDNIPDIMQSLLAIENCKGSIIYDHYYALTTRNDAGKLYNHEVLICDLNKVYIKEEGSGLADCCWVTWQLNAHYLLQTRAGELLMLDSNDRMIYSLSFDTLNDQLIDGSIINFEKYWRTCDQLRDGLTTTKQPLKIFINAEFEKLPQIIPYYYKTFIGSSDNVVEGLVKFIMGVSKMGDKTSTKQKKIEAFISNDVVGTSFAFAFKHAVTDAYFSFYGFQFTFRTYKGNA